MTRMAFSVGRDDRPSATVLSVCGDLDIATVRTLRGEVDSLLQAAPAQVHVDLTETTFIDSTGCRELVRAAKHGRAVGVPVSLVVPVENWRVRRVVDFMQFGELLPVHDATPP
jgi:anti-sigma B factor antagonist